MTFWIEKLADPILSEYLQITGAEDSMFYRSEVLLSSKCLKDWQLFDPKIVLLNRSFEVLVEEVVATR